MAAHHNPGLVRPHPPMPGVPTPGMHLLDLLSEPPEEQPAPVDPGRDPIAIAIAGVAALFATLALGVAVLTWLSLSDLRTLGAIGTPATGAPAPPAGPEEAASAQAVAPLTDLPDGQAPASDLLTAAYTPAYRPQSLQLALPACKTSAVRYVDLDEPRVDADASRADLHYQARSGCYGTPQLNLITGVSASVVTRASMRPAQCADSVRNAPANNPIPLTRSLVLCILTSSDKAIGEDISQKIVLLVVAAPAPSGATTIRATGWHVTH